MDPRRKEGDIDQLFYCVVVIVACRIRRRSGARQKEEWHSIFHGSADQDMANMVLRLGWEDKGYPMVIPRSGKPKLQITTLADLALRKVEKQPFLRAQKWL